jgi:hypothetical protein
MKAATELHRACCAPLIRVPLPSAKRNKARASGGTGALLSSFAAEGYCGRSGWQIIAPG